MACTHFSQDFFVVISILLVYNLNNFFYCLVCSIWKIYLKLSNVFEDEEEIQRVKGAAEDAALLEAMSEVEQDEQDQESLTDLELSEEQVNELSKSGIKNKDDLAELATDELLEIIDISEESASEMIMKAREHWFK